jgi:hypothetical protein
VAAPLPGDVQARELVVTRARAAVQAEALPTEEMSASEWQRLSEAVITWTGWGTFAFPGRDDALLLRRYGLTEAARLGPKVHAVASQFFASDAYLVAKDLTEMAEL